MHILRLWKKLDDTLSMKVKLLITFGATAVFLLTVGAIGFFSLSQVSRTYEHVSEIDLPKTAELTSMRYNAIGIARSVTHLSMNDLSQDEIEEHEYKLTHHIKKYEEAEKDYAKHPFTAGEGEKYKDVQDRWRETQDIVTRIRALQKSTRAEDRAKMHKLLAKDFSNVMDDLNEDLGILRDTQGREAAKWSKQAERIATVGRALVSIVVISGFGLALLVGYLFSRRLTTSLGGITRKLAMEAEGVATASGQISSSSEELASSSSEQAASLEETSAALEEVAAMVRKNAENANHSKAESENSRKSAENGKQVIDQMIRAIDDIHSSNTEIMSEVEKSNQEISAIVGVIREIGNKTKIINDIVFQTKLLSFNASVEAARAGEHGKGFAVVAEEVGKLAQMSGNAAKEISEMLDGSIRKVEAIVNATKAKVGTLVATGKEKTDSGAQIARRCGDVLEEIVRNVSNVNQMVAEISEASSEQSSGLQEIHKAVGNLDAATQKNSSVSHEAASAAEKLSGQAKALKSMVHELVTLVEGNRGTEAAAKPQPKAKKQGPAPKPEGGARVIPLVSKKTPQPAALKPVAESKPVPMKIAANGGGGEVPSESDPRFEEV
ncbi:MAG: methyl-accepting chemotaxis protein [Oligoflexia bacterium]|nr:methyl-accepting chemotaxis protein [Oligoflexia bacterium]